MIENYDSVDVFVGVDVGKGGHHAVALNRAGKVVFDTLVGFGCTRGWIVSAEVNSAFVDSEA